MNKTISVNIAGLAFIIEENAYRKLQHYLEAIQRKFSNDEERKEIMDDIEARIAEIFRDNLTNGREVIQESDVEEVMQIMGMPEDYVTDDSDQETNHSSNHETYTDTTKRLFRDPDNAMIGGVCSGLAYYFNMDPTLMRVIFVLLGFMGGGVLLYLVLLIFIPEAKSTNEKLQMKGQSITIDNIKEHLNNVKDGVGKNAKNAKRTIKKNVDKFGKAGGNFIRTFAKLFGLGLIIGGTFGLIFFITLFLFGTSVIPIMENGEVVGIGTLLESVYPENTMYWLIELSIFIVVLIPLISVVISGLRMVFGYHKTYRPFTISSVIIWFLAVGFLAINSVDLGMNFRNRAELNKDILLENDSTDVLYLGLDDEFSYNDNVEVKNVINRSELISLSENIITMGVPRVKIIPLRDSGNFIIHTNLQSSGWTLEEAIQNAEHIDYPVTISNNHVSVKPEYSFPREDKIRGQSARLIIKVPLGKKIIFGTGVERLHVQMDHYKYCDCKYDFAETEWENRDEEMQCIKCEND